MLYKRPLHQRRPERVGETGERGGGGGGTYTFWYLETQEVGAAAVGLLRLVVGPGHGSLSWRRKGGGSRKTRSEMKHLETFVK